MQSSLIVAVLAFIRPGRIVKNDISSPCHHGSHVVLQVFLLGCTPCPRHLVTPFSTLTLAGY